MRETRLTCDQFEFISILEVTGRKAANEHATFFVKGHIAADSDEYVLHSSAGQSVTFTASDWDGDKEIFNGIISDINIHTENEMRILSVSVVSRSTLMDLERHTRTFQDSNMTYVTVTSRMEEANPDFNFLWPTHGGTSIGSMTVQYYETDWQYSIRLAGRLGTVVVPDYLLDKPYISIGMPRRPAKQGINAISYNVRKDMQEYRDSKYSGGFSERDSVSYIVKSREIFDLCDGIPFQGLSLFVYAIDTKYEGDQLVHYYTLKEESGFFTPIIYNQNLIGVSLRGEVKDIQQDQVQIYVRDDVEQTDHKWFAYASPFTQPDGQGWYFMPEIGDDIRLQFPSEKEDDGYVLSAVHITHGHRTDPLVKFIRTIYGQVIQFDPEKILIDDGAGSSITMHRDVGIMMETDKDVIIDAESNITMSAEGKVVIDGEDGVILQKGSSVVSVDDAIDISSEHTRVQ